MQFRPQPGIVPSPPSPPDWSRRAFLQCSTAALAGFALRRSAAATGARQGWLAQPVEVDPESGAEIFQLTDGPRPTDNLYGEQPYNSQQGDRIAVRHYEAAGMDGGLSILDLTDGAL